MRMHILPAKYASALLLASILSACAQPAPSTAPPPPQFSGSVQGAQQASTPPAIQVETGQGRIVSIENITPRWQTQPSSPSGAGAAVGAVVGGALGNQIGGGRGRTLATLTGVAGGAVVGHRVESGRTVEVQSPASVFRITIQLDNGGQHTLDVPDTGDLRAGDRVRLSADGFISRI